MKISLMTFMVVIRKLIAGSITTQDKKDYSEFLKNVKIAGINHVDLTIMEFSSFGESYVKEVLREYDLKMSCLISGRPYATLDTSYEGFGAIEFVPRSPVPSVDEIKRELEFVLGLI